ncbi:MAG: hypothetical protein WD069_20850 [Planctomycetales bacterium]
MRRIGSRRLAARAAAFAIGATAIGGSAPHSLFAGPHAATQDAIGVVEVIADRPGDPCGIDLALRRLLESPEMADARFASLRRSLARLIPNAPSSSGEPDWMERQARTNHREANIPHAILALERLLVVAEDRVKAWPEPAPASVELYHAVLEALARDADGRLRLLAATRLAQHFVWTGQYTKNSLQPPAEMVRNASESLWDFLSSPETDTDQTRLVLDSRDLQQLIGSYLEFSGLESPAEGDDAVRSVIEAAAVELRQVLSAARRKLPPEEPIVWTLDARLHRDPYLEADPRVRDGIVEDVLRHKAWEGLLMELVRVVNADDKGAYPLLFRPERFPKIQEGLARKPEQPLKEHIGVFGPGIESVAIHSITPGHVVFTLATAAGPQTMAAVYADFRVSRTAEGWRFGDADRDPPPAKRRN